MMFSGFKFLLCINFKELIEKNAYFSKHMKF